MSVLNKSTLKYILVLHIVLTIYSFLSIASKLASKESFLSKEFIIYYVIIMVVLAFYAVAWQQIIKKLSLVTAYANKAVTVIWGIIWGFFLFEEQITWNKVIGSLMIIAGVYVIVSADRDEVIHKM